MPKETVTAQLSNTMSDEALLASARTGAVEAGAVALTPLIGRDTEVSLLKDRWEQAQEGMGQVVLLVGEAGLGKSRLVHTIKQVVVEQMEEAAPVGGADSAPGSRAPCIVEWRCAQQFQNTGLFPVTDQFARFLDFRSDESTTARFDRLARHLDDYGLGRPELVALFARLMLLPPDERYPVAGLTPVREREETFRALRQWLKACSDRHPLLFVIEDLHWIDASTLEFLGQFISEGLHDRILTVLTFRPEFKTSWPAFAHQTSLALNRLTRRQVGELMRKTAGSAPPEALVAQLYERTGGVPFLVEEFARIIRETVVPESGVDARRKGTAVPSRDIPATLQDLILARLDGLSANREVAQLAATLGREFNYDILAAVVHVDEEALRSELEKLVGAGILNTKGQPPHGAYVFKHALLEEALHGTLHPMERQSFHRRVAEAMETRFPEIAERQPELLAQHFTEAGVFDKAVSYWALAGLRSRERFANVEAIAHLTKGLGLLESLPPSSARDARELDLLGPLGTTYIASRGYAAPEVGPLFDRARELCDRVGQTPQLFAMMWGNFAFHVVRGDFRLCAELAEEAIEFGTRMNDAGILMEALFLRGITMLYRGDFAGAHEACSRAIAEYDDRARTAYWATLIGEDGGVTTRCYLALAQWHLGQADSALALNRETLALARDIRQPFSIVYALHHTGWLFQHCRMGAAVRAAGEEEMEISTEQGYPFWHATGTLYRGAGMLLQGRPEEALALIERGLEAYRATGAGIALTFYLSVHADALTQVGRLDDARRALDEAFALVEKNDERFQEAELLRLQGELLLAQSGDERGAEECFDRAIETARRQQSRAWELRATTSLARVMRQRNRIEQAYAALTTACDKITEGTTLPDLAAARALLNDLSNERMRGDFAAGAQYVRQCIPPPMKGPVTVDWRYIPSSELGGDSIGYHWIDDDHLALYLIDVTGHGLDSALLSISISNVIRSGSLPGVNMLRSDEVLARLNEKFQGHLHGGRFFTIWYGVYEVSTHVLHWSGGGHHPSLLFVQGLPEPIQFPSTGPMMGLMLDAVFPTRSFRVPSGSRLLIFSDGAFEIMRDQTLVWDLPACISYLSTISDRAGLLMDELLTRARTLRGSEQLEDDFSIIEARFE
ncbi:SpoIIE family protein phosphatase [Roseimicrobium sp. ORNL1]|uniref:SpoIIE family protein phosphatase n=1 Tax=Roseimicrobium sp. ORNL1 TaxID=2711231 RepID=UPI00198211B4|nr:SpoIIE family protein phosphatase [Roseimicrobium sp. ORNL1]